jgi:hypothetical protein
MKHIIKKLGLESKIEQEAETLKNMQEKHKQFYEYFEFAFKNLYKANNYNDYFFDKNVLVRDLELYRLLDKKGYAVLKHIYNNIVEVRDLNFEMKNGKKKL